MKITGEKIMSDNQFIDSLICSELGIRDFFELSDWQYDFFINKTKEIVREHKKKFKESLSKEELKGQIKAQKIFIKRLKYVIKNYTPSKMKLKLGELNNVGTFVSLRMDFLEIKNSLENIKDQDIEELCDKYIEKYNLDKNIDFIKSYGAKLNVKDEILLSKIGSWMNGYIEYFYDNSLMNNDITFDENFKVSLGTTYLLKKSEQNARLRDNIQIGFRKTLDYTLYTVLLLLSIILFTVGSFIKNDIIQSLMYSLAVTFLATFLIKILDNAKQSYYKHRINQIKDLLADISDCKHKIDNCLKDYKSTNDFKDKIEIFLDYKFDIDYYLKYIRKLLRFISILGEPFTNNYYSLKRYNEYIMSPMYSKLKNLFEFKDGKYILIKLEKDVNENIEEDIKESILGTYSIISDLYESIEYSVKEKLSYYEKLKK